MANDVFANGREISCKASSGKSICAFPDVCMTPPENPATPPGVPVPYPNTGMASDTTSGSKKVKISKKEVMLKNKSNFKKSMGNEAGCAAKKGVVTSTNHPPGAPSGGKAYFNAWSMDVKIEGQNAVRHLDLTTHNHASLPTNAPPQVHTALMAAAKISECSDAVSEVLRECEPWDEKAKCPEEQEARIDKAKADRDATKQRLKDSGLSDNAARNHPSYSAAQALLNDEFMAYTGEISKNKCRKAMRCILMPYKDMKKKDKDGNFTVKCRHQTPEHLIEQSSAAGVGDYKLEDAPCAFTEGTSWHLGEHGVMSAARRDLHQDWASQNPGAPYDTATAAKIGAEAHNDSNVASDCDPVCTEKQLLEGHRKMNVQDSDQLDPTQTGIADAEEQARRKEIMELQQAQLMDRAGG
jgi:hypothetical protein